MTQIHATWGKAQKKSEKRIGVPMDGSKKKSTNQPNGGFNKYGSKGMFDKNPKLSQGD